MPTTVRSHAKINLGLGIGAPRADGFHALSTVYQTLEMHDLVTVSAVPAEKTSIQLTSNDKRVPCDERNTAWKIVSLVLEELGGSADVHIHIEKKLPVQGGLGAGSANAVAALIGLEIELGVRAIPPMRDEAAHGWGTQGIGNEGTRERGNKDPAIAERLGSAEWAARRLEIAARVGSDVPLFLIGGTVLGLDRGQEVYPLPDIEPVWCVVAVPGVGVSTPQAFRDWDELCAREGLTAEASTDKLNKLSRAYASAFAGGIPQERQAGSSGVPAVGGDLAGPNGSALVRTGIASWIANDFEQVVFRQHPSLAEIKRVLAAEGTPEAALHASLSGSGSALFGLYLTREAAEAAVRRIEAFRGVEVKATLTRTVPRDAYWGGMILP
ncbi:MAG: 4-(cytidine 5'-diphospho)-2-C-methyl-D-erythritol kinase [Acidobacteriota bacterium]